MPPVVPEALLPASLERDRAALEPVPPGFPSYLEAWDRDLTMRPDGMGPVPPGFPACLEVWDFDLAMFPGGLGPERSFVLAFLVFDLEPLPSVGLEPRGA